MRILRLTNSSDIHDEVPEEQRTWCLVERIVAERTGEPVETVLKVIWPSPTLAGIVRKWIDLNEPDVLFMRSAAYWCSYESVPLRLRRRLPKIGNPIARVGTKVGETPALVRHRSFRVLRTAVVRIIGGDTFFQPEEAAGYVEGVLREALKNESMVVAVRGPGFARDVTGTRKGLARARRRNRALDEAMARVCVNLHVPFVSGAHEGDEGLVAGDHMHSSPEGQRRQAQYEGNLIADTWLAAHATPARP